MPIPPSNPTSRSVAAEQYDRLAGVYDHRWRFYIDATLRLVEESVECEEGDRLLDAPCGTGELQQRLLGRQPLLHILGIDLSRNMLSAAVKKSRRTSAFQEGRVHWLRADVSSIPAADESFDWVVCANSFHYFREPVKVLAEFRRVLRPGGRFVIVDWCDDYFTCRLCSMWLRWTNRAFHRTYSLRHCRQMLEEAGFVVDESNRFRVSWLWGLMRLRCTR